MGANYTYTSMRKFKMDINENVIDTLREIRTIYSK